MKLPIKAVNWVLALGLLSSGVVLGLASCAADVSDTGDETAGMPGEGPSADDPETAEAAEALGNAGTANAGSECADGLQNGLETDVDCGGGDGCPTCDTGKVCVVATDCASAKCTAGVCIAPTCSDGIKNGTETAKDCGGSCATKCLIGYGCLINADCFAGNCYANMCMPAGWKCSDGIKNGTESAIDCGGTNCVARCANGKTCLAGSDCTSGICTAGVCGGAVVSCSDGIKNGTETDIDCGGSCAADCANGKSCLAGTDCTSTSCVAGLCTALPTCSDGIKNGSESDVDCGGSCAAKCANGKTCGVNADCSSTNCSAGLCAPPAPTCTDGVKNGTETDVDCGGSCVADCANSKTCSVGGDCTSTSCIAGICTALPTCSDGIKNGSESDVDCGGSCAAKCANGKTCGVNADCSSTNCSAGLCAPPAPTCTDGVKNGTETDVDCGGSCAADCANGKTCLAGTDCTSTSCVAGICTALPTCSDGIKNGSESDVDCGGTCAAKCANGKTCGVNADCSSTNCSAGVCAAPLPTCTDGMKNGTETDVDCGGSCAADCANGKTCLAGTDCTSTSCVTGICTALPTCADGIKNGSESDIDCGGSCAAKCANGKTCSVGADCSSTNCSAGVCAAPAPTCTDGVKNGTETDIDCGGSCAADCANGKTCLAGTDCTSGTCTGGVCVAPSGSCSDGIKNGTETAIDCGGTCATKCLIGKTCLINGDCFAGNCYANVCMPTGWKCADGIKNGTETAIDCGGTNCAAKCADGKTCVAGSDCTSGVCTAGVCGGPAVSCSDGIKNGTETDVDCGGSCAADCANGKTCLAGTDCTSTSCVAGLCAALPTCSDAVKNGTETDIDCGGSCAANCANGQTCAAGSDCISGSCIGGICAALPTCSDAVKNGTETDIDCGGSCAANCANGQTCLAGSDCTSTSCVAGLCAALPTCTDGVKNGTETDIDCGGSCAANCANGQTCAVGTDCTSTSCVAGLCAALPTCTDGVKNGTETDIDCGGSCAANCANGQTCAAGSDCTSGSCVGGLCAALPTCSDAVKNGTETDVDCGGSCAANCANGQTCAVGADCTSTSCVAGLCAALPTCSDAVKNGTETDVDCGGATCGACANGKLCAVNGDCTSVNCAGGVCAAPGPTCTDALKNGTESDVDCGGSVCVQCGNGKTCGGNGDCLSSNCSAGVCAAPLPTCTDGVKNGSETDVDCGGATCGACANGKLCSVNGDCASANCDGGVCAAPGPTCTDAVKNGAETDVDCGGLVCVQCGNGKTCAVGGDCSSNSCVGGVCTAAGPGCDDGVKNGTETDVDCGGSCAADCANGKTCNSLVDCQSASCASGVCAAIVPTCTDGVKNGAETDVDCGGGTCGKCANGKTCTGNTDCASAGCVGGVCSVVAATCSDGIKNGAESDVDCGSAGCPKCAVGKTCASSANCVIIGGFAQCQNAVCIVPNSPCNDVVKNGTETDVDCGGAACGKCSNGWICAVGSDCKSGSCVSNICVPVSPTCVDGIKNGGETDTDCGGPVCAKCASGQGCSNNGDCSTSSCVGNACAASGALQHHWTKRFGNATDQECDVVKTDASEDIFLANYITGKVDFGLGTVGSGEYISLVKLNPAGTTLWSKAYPYGTKQYPNGLAVNATGNLFLSGSYFNTLKFGTPAPSMTSLGSDDFYAAGHTNVGAPIWAKSFGSASQFQQFNQGAVDTLGNPVMTGWINGSANFGGGSLNGNNVDVVVVKLDKSNGAHLWSKSYGNGDLQGGHGVVVDGSGNVIVVGYMNGSLNFGGGAIGGGTSIFLLKLNSAGNYVWAKAFSSTLTELKTHRVAVDAAGNIFIGGGKRGSVNFGGGSLATNAGAGIYDAFVAKFDANGNHLWSKSFGDGNEQWVSDLVVDAAGNVVITGSFLGSINFGGGSMTSLGGTEFGGDVFLAKLSGSNGAQLFAARYGDASQQEPKSLTLDPSGNVIVCGLFRGSINFGGGALATAGTNDIFVTKMTLP